MPAVCRAGDIHTCGSEDTGGSPNVFVNGRAAHRQGDSQSHGGIQHDCSSTVFVNGRGIARVGDFTLGEPPPPIMHGDNPQATGSPDVFAGGQNTKREAFGVITSYELRVTSYSSREIGNS